MNEEKLIEHEKEVERENEKNINDAIDFMSIHINEKMTKEYLKFIKKTRKIKRKIGKKKAKLAENGMLEQAYQKKEGKVDEYFKEIVKDYNETKQSIAGFEGVSYYIEYWRSTNIIFIERRTLMGMMARAAQEKKYIDQTLYKKLDKVKVEPRSFRENVEGVEMKARKEIIQEHYNTITTYIMGKVLCYYDLELCFWKDEYKKIEKLDDIRDFE